jgi:hypothetical protein
LTGGGSLIKELDKKIVSETTIPVNIVENPLIPVIMGIGNIIEDLKTYRPLLSSNKNKNSFFSNKKQDTESITSQQNIDNIHTNNIHDIS